MPDETTEKMATDAAPAEAAAPASEKPSEKPKAGLVSYIVQHTLLHDNHEYAKGDLFQHPDENIIATLRRAKAIALQTEVQSADAVAQRIAELEAQLAAAQIENAKLATAREQAVTQTPTSGSGQSGKSSK